MIDPIGELKYRLALANEHLRRAEMYCQVSDWAGCVHYSQLSIENFAKALISMYEVPTWSHDPSNQLLTLLSQLPEDLRSIVRELALMSREVTVEHARSTYGEPSSGLTPGMLYDRDYASALLNKARRARDIVNTVLRRLGIEK